MITSELLRYVESGKLNKVLSDIYGEENVDTQKERYCEAISDFAHMQCSQLMWRLS